MRGRTTAYWSSLNQDPRHQRAGVVDAGIAKNYQKLMAFKKAFYISVWKQTPPWIRQNIRRSLS
jgi:hypothetical protein